MTGTGFKAGALIAVWADFSTRSGPQRSTVTAHSSADGGFDADVPVPAGTRPGRYAVIATDYAGHRVAATVQVELGVVLRAGSVPPATPVSPGDKVEVSGTGFTPAALVTIRITFPLFSGKEVAVVRTAKSDPSGNFSGSSLSVPYGARSGLVTLQASDDDGTLATAPLDIEYHPAVSVHPSPIPRGAVFDINGEGFVPGSRVNLTLTRGGTSRPAFSGSTRAGRQGRIQSAVRAGSKLVPATYTLAASGQRGASLASATVTVTAGPVLTANKLAVVAGGTMTVLGYHFPAGSRISLSAVFPLIGGGSRALALSARSGPFGNFAVVVHIPIDAATGQAHLAARAGFISRSAVVPVTEAVRRIVATPQNAAPGESLSISGIGFAPGTTVAVRATFTLTDGTSFDTDITVSSGSSGTFTAPIQVPEDAAPGTYHVAATAAANATVSAPINISTAAPALVALPRVAAPGTALTVAGFGFAPQSLVSLSFDGSSAGTTTADASGRFSARVSVPATATLGKGEIVAVGGSTTTASAVKVSPTLTTRRYFPALYTGPGYHESIALLNPTESDAHVSISYHFAGTKRIRDSFVVAAHTRATHDVNTDVGPHASVAAVLTSDQPVAAERLVEHQSDIAVDPGAGAPASRWYFASGNTSHGYREYVSVQNPNTEPVETAFDFAPAHGRAFTLFKTVGASSRLTLNVNTYVSNDAVSVRVSAPRPIVAGRTMFIRDGMTSKTGVSSPSRTWYFASGPRQANAVNWVSVYNPGEAPALITLSAFGLHGGVLASTRQRVAPDSSTSILISRLAQHPDVSVSVSSPTPVVAEQNTYVGTAHQASTATFGLTAPLREVQFAAMGTRSAFREADSIDVFNPAAATAAVLLEYVTTSGTPVEQSIFVGPRARAIINVGVGEGDVELGATLVATRPVVVLNRYSTDGGKAADTSAGIQPPA